MVDYSITKRNYISVDIKVALINKCIIAISR